MRWLNLFSFFFVGLFGALMLVAAGGMRNSAHGVYVYLPQLVESDVYPCQFSIDRSIVLQVMRDGLKINQDTIAASALPGVMAEIFKTRQEKVALFTAEPDVDFQDVAEMLSSVQAAVPELRLVALTPKVNETSGYWVLRSGGPDGKPVCLSAPMPLLLPVRLHSPLRVHPR